MLGVFGQAGWATTGKPSRLVATLGRLDDEDEELVLQRLAGLRESLPHRHRASVTEQVLGPGTGIAFIQGPNIQCASRGGVTVLFMGHLDPPKKEERIPAWGHARPECASNWQTESEQVPQGDAPPWNDAKRVLDLYKRADWGGLQGPDLWAGKGGYPCLPKSCGASPRAAAKLLGGLGGRFAFTIWDRVHQRLVAARDPQAQEALFWGAPTFGEGLLFATDRFLVEEEAADADQFPPGTFFCLTPDDGTDGTGVMSSFEMAAEATDNNNRAERSSEDEQRVAEEAECGSGAVFGEGADDWGWAAGIAPLTPCKRHGTALQPSRRRGAMRRSMTEALSDEESSSEEDRVSTCAPPTSPGLRLGSPLSSAPQLCAPLPSVAPSSPCPSPSPGKPCRKAKPAVPILRVTLRCHDQKPPRAAPPPTASPVSPRTAVRRVVAAVMTRVHSAEGMCRVSSGENLTAMLGAQIQAK